MESTSRPVPVYDPSDPRLADYMGLRDPARRSRVEPAGGFFVAEGVAVIERVLRSGLSVRSILLSPAKYERLAAQVEGLGIPVYVADRAVVERVVGFDLHRGAVASVDRPPRLEVDALLGARSLAVLEGINDHENLGAIFRSAAAFGIGGLLLDPSCADPWYRRSVRVSMGGVLTMPSARSRAWPEDLDRLRDAGFATLALTVADGAVPIESVDVSGAVAVVLGAEGPGLRRQTIDRCDLEVTIPMSGSMDSLNVGHAAAIAFHRLAG